MDGRGAGPTGLGEVHGTLCETSDAEGRWR